MSPQEFSEMDPDQGPPRTRRTLRADRRNLQAIAIAAVPIVVLLAVVILGIMLVRGRSQGASPEATATLLPTARPTTLVAAVRTTEATATAAPVTPTTAPTTEPTQAATDAPAEPEEPTPTPTPSDELVAGAVAVVSDTAGRGLNMRADASVNAIALKVLQEGAEVTIIGGPTDADGFTWLQVRDAAEAEGWVAADWLVRVR